MTVSASNASGASTSPGVSDSDVIRRLEVATLALAQVVAGGRRELTARFNPVTGIVHIFQRFRVVTAASDREGEVVAKEATRLGWRDGDHLLVELLHSERDRERVAAHEARYGALLSLGPAWRSFGQVAAGIVRQVSASSC